MTNEQNAVSETPLTDAVIDSAPDHDFAALAENLAAHSRELERANAKLREENLTLKERGVEQFWRAERAERSLEQAMSVLTDALEYFEEREDVVDGSYGEQHANREMHLASAIRASWRSRRERGRFL